MSILFISYYLECRTLEKSKLLNPEPDKPCVFPFKYGGKEYDKCTTHGWGNVYWCGTTYSVGVNSGWGLCKCPECGCPAPETKNGAENEKSEKGNFLLKIDIPRLSIYLYSCKINICD